MPTNTAAFLSFVLVTTFTPGPNNISSASMGVLYGFRRTLRYMLGILAGFFVIMLLCGWISTTLLRIFPSVETVLRLVGAGYILWLAYHTLRTSYAIEETDQPAMGFVRGMLLQILNPKVIVYGMTLYSGFLASLTASPFYLLLSAFLLAATAFVSTCVWALFGSAIGRYLHQPVVRRLVNLTLSLLLVYTAIELSGVTALI
jgi:cysteine/O-acetylserine efflux protein